MIKLRSCDTCRFFLDRDKELFVTDLCALKGENHHITKVKKVDIAATGCAAWRGK